MTATATKPKRRASGIALATASLKAALNTVRDAVPSRSPKPVLLNVLMHNGALTATTLDVQISAEIAYSGDPLLLPFHRLDAILKSASGDEAVIEPKGTSAVVRIGSGEWTLPVEDAAEFPRWEPQNAPPVARIPADQFVRAVRCVSYATDQKSNRYALGAVLVEMRDGTLTFIGTDGRRLSTYEVEVDQATDVFVANPKNDGEKRAPHVPAGVMNTIEAIAKDSEGAVQLDASRSELVATIDGTVVTARLIDGQFPQWRDVFPERDNKATTVSAPELLAATRQAAIVTTEDSKGVTFAFTPQGIHLTARSAAAGEASVTCQILDAGDVGVVKLDPRFVADWLKAVDPGVAVEINVAGQGDAVVLRAEDYRGVIMPLGE